MQQPLQNIRVLDLTHVIAGPFCAYQLAVMGAEVIKVEPPAEPDVSRAVGDEFPWGEQGLGYFYTAQNANKRAIAVDLKTERGREIILALCRKADVFIENYRAGALARLGLGYDDLSALKPDLIYCSLTGFGQDGPLGGRTAYDNVIQAFSGLMAATGDADTAPLKVGPPVLDYGAGMQAAYAIVCALLQRAAAGPGQQQGQHIDVAMLDCALMLTSANITYWQSNGELLPLTGNDSAIYPGYSCFDTRAGKIMLGAYNQKQVRALWTALGDPEHGAAVAAHQPRAMGGWRERDTARLAPLLRQKTAAEWETLLNAAGVPAARVRALDETLAEAQLRHRDVLQPDGRGQNLPVAGFKYRRGGPRLKSPPPVFAQDTRPVLRELGYNDAAIDELAADGVIAVDDQP